MSKKLSLQLGKGVNRDQPAWELAPGTWSDIQNARVRAGCDERVGGIASAFTPSVVPYAIETFDVAINNAVSRYVVYIGLTKAYVWDGSTTTEITRGRGGAASVSGGGAVVTVNSAAHGLTTGDNVIIGGTVPDSYNTGNTGATITVVDPNNFTYVNASVAAVTTQGYWESNRTNNFTAAAGEEITTCVLNGILYVNTLLDGCYYWAGANSLGTLSTGAQGRLRRLRSLSTGPNVVYGRSICSYKDYLFVFGFLGTGISANTTTSSSTTKKPYDIAWGQSAEPGSVPSTFLAAASNDAGLVQKTLGAVVHGKEWNDSLYIYHEHGRVVADYTGGNQVFNFRTLNDGDGLIAANNIANTPAGQFFFSQNRDLKVHTGSAAKSVCEGRNLNWIRANIDSTYYARSFVRENKRTGEVWLCIPESGSSTCTLALLYNYGEDAWGERDLSNVTCGASGMLPTSVATDERLILGTTGPNAGLTESGTTDFGSTFTSLWERTGMNLGDSDLWKTLHQSRPLIEASSAITASVYHGSAATQDATPTYGSAITYTHNTTKRCDGFANSGPYIAFKMTTTAAEAIKVRTIDVFFNQDGTD